MDIKRVDQSQREIVRALRAAGVSVFVTSAVGSGFPDLVIGYDGVTYLCEIKTGKNPLTSHQEDFIHSWTGGEVIVARTVEEILRKIGRL